MADGSAVGTFLVSGRSTLTKRPSLKIIGNAEELQVVPHSVPANQLFDGRRHLFKISLQQVITDQLTSLGYNQNDNSGDDWNSPTIPEVNVSCVEDRLHEW